ncbi:MAG: Gfo/Idh/MocA family protein [Gemmataceae bacterium]
MIRIGVIDFDTSHVTEFARRLNRRGVPEDQWVHGAEVVVGCPGESDLAPERIPGFAAEMHALGVPLVGTAREMLGGIDAVIVHSLEGGAHLERARPFLEAGLPCFIDKPFACSVADARKIEALAAKYRAPVFSASAMRYAPEVVAYRAPEPDGPLLGAVSYGPATLVEQRPGGPPRNPGLFHYGIHPAEMLYALMGPGCERVSCAHEPDVDVVTARWRDGRVATLRGLRSGARLGYGFLAFAERGTRHVAVDTAFAYRELLKRVVDFFRTGAAPVPIGETVELMAFLEAALRSGANGGAGEWLQT